MRCLRAIAFLRLDSQLMRSTDVQSQKIACALRWNAMQI
jgi:hypothetical protein